jgi:RNA polymerase sigma-70 factor (ECF subfamily)
MHRKHIDANDPTQNHHGGTMATSSSPIPLLNPKQIPSMACIAPNAYNSSNRAELVRSAQNGDPDAFAELYAQNKKQVFSICMRMVRSFPLAEDLTQETFLQVHRKLASFRGDSVFSTWLHRTAVNIVLMHLRKRALNAVSLDHLMANTPDERTGRSFGTRDLTQAGVIDRLAIDQVIDTMAPGYRSIFILHDVHGFDHGEIASMLNCSSGNTKSQLHKARRVLRGALSAKTTSPNGISARRAGAAPTRLRSIPNGSRQSARSLASPFPSS